MATKTQPVSKRTENTTEATRQGVASKLPLTPEERYRRIAKAAYHKAEQHGFEPGHEREDWLAAEKEIEALGDYWTLPLTTEERHRRIAEAAYRKAEQGGFEPGHELEYWLAAEKEIEAWDYWSLP